MKFDFTEFSKSVQKAISNIRNILLVFVNSQNHFDFMKIFSHFQAQALSNAIIAYASYADNLGALSEPLKIIAHKHVSLQIPPSYYEVVGQELINAIKEVLKEAAAENIIEAWTDGYFFLAKTLMKIESEMKTSNQNLTGKSF